MNELEFGIKIKARREELGLSQKDLASALNLDQGKVSLIERGGRKIDGVQEIPILAKVLKKPISWFYEDIQDIEQEKDSLKGLLKEYLPDLEFSDFEVKKMRKILEPVVSSLATSYVEVIRKAKSK
ncbi:MAG: helix-turn-helix domain-containing protein [Candidatus Melainabacteria bacterium]